MREYLLVLAVAALVTYLTTPVARRGAMLFGAMAEVRDRDVHAIPTPRLGGVAMCAGLFAALAVASQMPFLGQVFRESRDPLAIAAGAGLICVLGVADDRWGLDPLTKLSGQVLATGVMVVQGMQILWLPVPGLVTLSLTPAQGVLLTVLIVVLSINAVNFVDGLDGLAAGIVGIGAMAFASYSYLLARLEGFDRAAAPTLIAMALTGMCLGFLPHNFFPARVFMGDSGSMLIGLLLAASMISLTGQTDPGAVSATIDYLPVLLLLLLPLAVLAVPFLDLMLAVVRRTRAGQSPFAPDKQHLHHRLLEIGHSQSRAVLIMYVWTAIIAFGAMLVPVIDGPVPLLVLAGVIMGLALLTLDLPRIWARRG